jgi:hypothetical protein
MEKRTAGNIKTSWKKAYTNIAVSQVVTGHKLIRLMSTTDCFITTEGIANADGTTAGSTYLVAFAPEYFEVTDVATVSVVRVLSSGDLYITGFHSI